MCSPDPISQGLFWAGRARCTSIPVPSGGQHRAPPGRSIPGDPFVTFSPFSPAPPNPTSTCGAERAVRANGVKHQPGGRDEGEQSLQFVLGVREDPARRVREGGYRALTRPRGGQGCGVGADGPPHSIVTHRLPTVTLAPWRSRAALGERGMG